MISSSNFNSMLSAPHFHPRWNSFTLLSHAPSHDPSICSYLQSNMKWLLGLGICGESDVFCNFFLWFSNTLQPKTECNSRSLHPASFPRQGEIKREGTSYALLQLIFYALDFLYILFRDRMHSILQKTNNLITFLLS